MKTITYGMAMHRIDVFGRITGDAPVLVTLENGTPMFIAKPNELLEPGDSPSESGLRRAAGFWGRMLSREETILPYHERTEAQPV